MTKKPKIRISGTDIGSEEPPYIIAEMSANHNGNIEKAMDIIRVAKASGANAIKLQTYKPDTITLNSNTSDFQINGGPWDGRTLYELYEEAHMPWDWHKPLFDLANEVGITIFSSPFDDTAVDLLEELNAPAYKIASFEAVDLPLIKYAASTGKPLIISTGLVDNDEIQEAIEAAHEGGCSELAILHCVSEYPAPAADYNLRSIPETSKQYNIVSGLSDHTLGNTTAIAAIALGASIIEKHITLDRKSGGVDDSFSIEPPELANLCRDAKITWEALGAEKCCRASSDQANMKFRRSLYFVKELKAGHVITKDDVRSVRPGFGLPPKFLEVILGKQLSQDVLVNSPVRAECLVGMKNLK